MKTQYEENLVSRQTERIASKIEGLTHWAPGPMAGPHKRLVQQLSLAIVLTTMAAKADEFAVKLDELGQSTVIG